MADALGLRRLNSGYGETVVIEDVDLIAEERDHYGGETPLLFTLLNEMDGLDEDADVIFLLTTNRADLL